MIMKMMIMTLIVMATYEDDNDDEYGDNANVYNDENYDIYDYGDHDN